MGSVYVLYESGLLVGLFLLSPPLFKLFEAFLAVSLELSLLSLALFTALHDFLGHPPV